MSDCVFCDIVSGLAPAAMVSWGPDHIVIVPLRPVMAGHVLVIPRAHVSDFAANPTVTAQTMHAAAQFAKSNVGYEQCNLITSRGPAATQTVFHLHLHLLPRVERDGVVLPWTEHQRRVEERAIAEVGWAEHTS